MMNDEGTQVAQLRQQGIIVTTSFCERSSQKGLAKNAFHAVYG